MNSDIIRFVFSVHRSSLEELHKELLRHLLRVAVIEIFDLNLWEANTLGPADLMVA